jgi:thiol-disulfide isomerase/thioredoxin
MLNGKPMSKRARALLAAATTVLWAAAATAAEPIAKIDIPRLEALINGNQGKVTIVNFWATWCPPCLKEFPDIIKLYNQYHDRGLEVVAISMNEPEEMEDIAAFIQDHNPPFPVYLAATLDETFYSGIGNDWQGLIPLTLIFDTEGKSAHFHLKEVNFAGLEQDISALLPPAVK